ncbi:hypothetical protein ORV05_14085 [Amycolatopsis cynarae]|uniref:DUF4352 domain-containing protein n=1 Tax=Amycolatopsis cynarae TaxID=2995223 RepID=A0ABY7B9L7_9PSEU|nr:hypothetical protein [Amycolatopsis sp. HUAS 11-8]WAL68841.1 hypothetical protein ORV05_14085 [Amycolatopsis sp. HUAS 11-8]
MRLVVVSLIVASGLALTGCAGQSTNSQPSTTAKSSSAARQVMAFGEERAGKRGVITVGRPTVHELPSDPVRAKDLTRGLRFDVVVKNTSNQAIQASSFTFAATSNGAPATLVTDPAQNIGDKLSSDVLPGTERRLGLVLALPAKPSEITVKVTFERTNPLYWTGTI